MPEHKILIVEDETRLAEALCQIMTEQKYTADVVYDGQDGLDYALSGMYDVVILDVMLPGEDGVEILKKLKANTTTRNIPVIMATAKGA